MPKHAAVKMATEMISEREFIGLPPVGYEERVSQQPTRYSLAADTWES
jgi:hypothetical protein